MTTPMKYDDAVRLIGGGGNTGELLRNKFYQAQRGRSGSFADKMRGYLIDEGCTSGGWADMWRQYLSRPNGDHVFTDGMKATTTLPRNAHTYKYDGGPEGIVTFNCTAIKA